MNGTLIRKITITVFALVLTLGIFAIRPERSSADGVGIPDPETGCILIQDEQGNWVEHCQDVPGLDGTPCTSECF